MVIPQGKNMNNNDDTPRQMAADLFKTKKVESEPKPKSPRRPREKKSAKQSGRPENISAKDQASAAGEPYIDILSIDVDANDPGQGAFELDWNDIFVARLIKAGYQGKTDQDIVDNWFRTVCRNVLMETYEQEMADPEKRSSNRRNLGNGRTEIS
jgi:hypothetical protein